MHEWLTGEKPKGTVVIVHGAGEHHGHYDWLRERFNQAGYHVVAGDLPGHGEDAHIKGHVKRFQDYIEAIEQWVHRAQKLAAPVFLFGHSMGGLAAIRAMETAPLPVSMMILSSPCLGLKSEIPPWMKIGARIMNLVKPTYTVDLRNGQETEDNSTSNVSTHNEDVLEEMRQDPELSSQITIRWYVELEKAMKKAFSDSNDLPDVPLLIMQAGDDKIVDKTAVRHWYDSLLTHDRKYREWPGLYHEVFHEVDREQVMDATLMEMHKRFSAPVKFS